MPATAAAGSIPFFSYALLGYAFFAPITDNLVLMIVNALPSLKMF